jgi:2-polyprenyl-6-methoxyphenol hydroxylase-like FAD-dependent oxidoreductase
MKVIIVGAGLAGLSTAIALRKYIHSNPKIREPLDIKIYDRSDELQITSSSETKSQSNKPGNLRNLGAGLGLQVNGLRVLNDFDPALRDEVYAAGFPCRGFTWKTSGDFLLGKEYLDVLPISRPFLVECLQAHLPEDAVIYKTISQVVIREGQKPIIRFEDGSPDETADLIIGADGIRSIVRQGIFTEHGEIPS